MIRITEQQVHKQGGLPWYCMLELTFIQTTTWSWFKTRRTTWSDGDVWRVNFSRVEWRHEIVNGSYSKTQAEIIIRDFFKNIPVKSFTLNHQGSSDDGSKYIIGTYKTSSTEYRVYILLKKLKDKLLIHQLQFEED